MRILGLSQGRADDPLAASGLNQAVFGALARRAEVVEVLDVSLRGAARCWHAARHWHPNRDAWRERFDLSPWSFERLSRAAGEMLAARRGEFDVALQLRTLFAPGLPPAAWPYAIMVDNTYALSDRYYPPWAPLKRTGKKRWMEMERAAYHGALAVFARTEWVRRSLIEDYQLPAERAVWVGTGSHFAPGTVPASKNDDGHTVLFVGKEFERKGGPTLLAAFAQVRLLHPDARLVLVGRELRLRQAGVEVLGKVTDRERLRELYSRASVFVLPSRFEPCGLVLAEAMAYRLPCVVTDAGGVTDLVVDGQTGYIVPRDCPELLAGRISELLGDPELRRRMGQMGARRVQEGLNWAQVIDRMLPVLEQATAGGGGQ